MRYHIEKPLKGDCCHTYRSLDPRHISNEHLNLLHKIWHDSDYKKLKDILKEIIIKFDTNPDFYTKQNYQQLINLVGIILNNLQLNTYNTHPLFGILDKDNFDARPEDYDYSYIYIVLDSGELINFKNQQGETITITEEDIAGNIVILNPVITEDNSVYNKIIIPIEHLVEGAEGNVSIFDANGRISDSGVKIGSVNLSDAPNTLATEQAVKSAIDDITIEVKEGDKFLAVDDKALSATISIDYDSTLKKIYLKGKSGDVVSTIDATEFIKDGMLDSAVSGFCTIENGEYKDAQEGDEGAVPCIKLIFNTDAGKTPVYLSFNDLVSYTIDAAKEQLWAELKNYVDDTKKEINSSTEAALDLKASKVKGNTVKDKIAILTEVGDLQNSEVIIGQENFKESSIVTITCQGQRYYVDVPKELIYTDLTNTPIYSDVFFKNEVGYISGQGMSGTVYVIINNNSTQATIGMYTGFMPNIVATELGVENYITSYVSTYEDINNILNTIP